MYSIYTLWDDAVQDRKAIPAHSPKEEGYIYKGCLLYTSDAADE